MSATPEQLLTIPQVAQALAVSRTHVYELIAAGALPTVQVGLTGSKRRVTPQALAAFINSRTARVTPHAHTEPK